MPRSTARFNDQALAAMGLAAPARGGLDGSGITITVIDYGFDLLHPTLISSDGATSRFSHVWSQPAGVPASGVELDRSRIGKLIAAARRTSDRTAADAVYDPHASYYGTQGVVGGAHGTSVASIAAGTAVGGFRGAAPAADLIGVHLALPDHGWKEQDAAGRPTWLATEATPGTSAAAAATTVQSASPSAWDDWRSYDAAKPIVDGLAYAHSRATHARAKGLVVNLSIGTWAGAHDGRSAVERAITELIEKGRSGRGPAVAVVVGAGNAGADRGHFAGRITGQKPSNFVWRVPAGDSTQRKLEIWYQNAAPLCIKLSPPVAGGVSKPILIEPGRTQRLIAGGRVIGIADHVCKARGQLSRARLLLYPPSFGDGYATDDSGCLPFTVTLSSAAPDQLAAAGTEVHAWIERDLSGGQPSTLHPSTELGTLCAFAAARGAIVVAGYDHNTSGGGPFAASSLGPVPWDGAARDITPLVAAPAHRIWGAQSKTDGVALTSGTSAAAALVSGLVAVLMQRSSQSNRRIHVDGIVNALVAGAHSIPARPGRAATQSWDPRYGFGAARLTHTLEELVDERAFAS